MRDHSSLLIDVNLTTIIVRKLRRWAVMVPRTPVDLHGLCISYQCVGAMGLPRDIVEEIIHFHRKDTRTLKACSLTCRALFSAARGLIHGMIRLSFWRSYPPCKLVDRIAEKVHRGWRITDWYEPEVHMRYLSMAGKRRLLGHAREVNIDIGHCFVPEALEACLPHFRSFTQVHTLTIGVFCVARFLPVFGRYFAQFVPTLRSLHLPYVQGSIQDVLEFVCKFPYLDDLSLASSLYHSVDVRPILSVEHSPPLRGTLDLRGWTPTPPAWFLLEIPGGLHFRAIYANRVGKEELDKILAACSSDLKTLSLRPRSRKSTPCHLPSGKVGYRSLIPLLLSSSGYR